MIRFDCEGHIQISPKQFVDLSKSAPRRFVNDVLCHGTPAVFNSYIQYCEFLQLVADNLQVSPLSISIRGSGQIGFSASPRPSKVWVELGGNSDLDLAIVDPDHFHLFDGEIRRWERTNSDERIRLNNLRSSRRFYYYRHYDLPSTSSSDLYKKKILEIGNACGREVTAFFFRDTWAFHERQLKDVKDLLFRYRFALPAAKDKPRKRQWLNDTHLNNSLTNQTELNLARTRSYRRQGITNEGLSKLEGLGLIKSLWLDSCDVNGNGLGSLRESKQLEFLSLADTPISDNCLQQVVELFPNLKTLILDDTNISLETVEQISKGFGIETISLKNCGCYEKRYIKNKYNKQIMFVY